MDIESERERVVDGKSVRVYDLYGVYSWIFKAYLI